MVNPPFFDSRLYSPAELLRLVGGRARMLRQSRSLRQSDLAEAVGVTTATIARFEQTGRVGFDVVARIAITLGAEAEVAALFARSEPRRIDEIVTDKASPQRVRRK
jgi:transcriptional regulator with XRE-family HTH domain